MGTAQAAVARPEGGRVEPSPRTLERFARATGARLRIRFEPARAPERAPILDTRAITEKGGAHNPA
jgi:transcriptional regulator with XRE-family HTH domain